jgi:hypothetical protein
LPHGRSFLIIKADVFREKILPKYTRAAVLAKVLCACGYPTVTGVDSL